MKQLSEIQPETIESLWAFFQNSIKESEKRWKK